MATRARFLMAAIVAIVIAPPIRAQTAASGPASHYVVFSLAADGTVTPVHHELVAAPAARSRSEQEVQALTRSGNAERVAVELKDARGNILYRDVVEARTAALELGLHSDRTPSDRIHTRDGEAADLRYFVARLPARSGSTIEVRAGEAGGMGTATPGSVSRFELESLATDSNLHATSAAAAAPRIRTLRSPSATAATGPEPSANRLDLLIMSEGYTANQAQLFAADAADAVAHFFASPPFSTYRSFFKVTTLFTPSAQAGADHPQFAAGCSSADCCADPAAQSDPRAGTAVTTAFAAAFCDRNVHRFLRVDNAKVLAAAAAVPEWDEILLLVNDPAYGGRGGAVSVITTHDQSLRMAQHEFGHSFMGLADEYAADEFARPACSDTTGPACEPNATDQTDRDRIKWLPWIGPDTPVPTDQQDGTVVGLFEGARSEETGYYRPKLTCLMKDLGEGLCDICAQEFVRRLYQGGALHGGIDPIEPGTETPPPGAASLATGASLSFHAAILQPTANTVAATWLVNGTNAGTGDAFTFQPTAAGTYTVELQARDTTPLVRATSLTSTRRWTVNVAAAGTPAPCAAGGPELCLAGDRFRVRVSWRNQHAGGATGAGSPSRLSQDTGYFWFFNPNNAELMVKILDGRPVNGKFWVFYGSLSDVEYTITITDTVTGAVKTYRNPPGTMASVSDTNAL